MKRLYFCLAIIVAIISFSSCEKKDYSSYPPTWEGFRFEINGEQVSPTSLRAGDVVKVTAVQKEKGRLINGTDYIWRLSVAVFEEDGVTPAQKDSLVEIRKHTNYDGTDNGDPSCVFTIPVNARCTMNETGNATITFLANFIYSGSGVQIENGLYNSALSGTIKPKSGVSAGGADGNVRLLLHSKTCGH